MCLRGAVVRALDLQSTGPWASRLHACSSVIKQYNLVPANGRRCSAAGEVTAGLAESNGRFMASVTCGLTAEDRDQLRNPTLVSSTGLPFLTRFEVMNKKALRETQTLRPGGAKNFRQAADPLPRGAGRPKFYQLKTDSTLTYKPSLVRIDARNFQLSW